MNELINFSMLKEALRDNLILQLILDMCVDLSRTNPKGLDVVYSFLCSYHTPQNEGFKEGEIVSATNTGII